MSRGQRTRSVLAWSGLGLVAGALVLSVVTLVLHWGREDLGTPGAAGGEWFWACALGAVVLASGVLWVRDPDREIRGEPSVWVHAGLLAVGLVIAAYLAYLAFPAKSLIPAGESAGLPGALPVRVRVWVVTCAVALGLVLMFAVPRRMPPFPLSKSLPGLVAGALVVVVAGVLVQPVLYPLVRHTTAEGLSAPGPVPASVSRVGWTWEPEPDMWLYRVEDGSHGPLLVLSDGVLSMDGTDGTELWSFRRPYDDRIEVWVDDEHVFVTHKPATGDEEAVTEVLDLTTGEPVPGHESVPEELRTDLDHGFVARTTEHVVHLERHGDDGGSGRELIGRELGTGEALWSRPLPPEDGQFCDMSVPQVWSGLSVSTHVCADEMDEASDTVGYSTDGRVIDVEFTVVAVDLHTGEEAWRHEWSGTGESTAPRVSTGGPAAEGEHPVVIVDWDYREPDLVLDTRTGEEAVEVPLDSGDEDVHFEGLFGADTGSATYLVSRGWMNTAAERVDAQGEVVDTVDTGPVPGISTSGGAVLEDAVLALRHQSDGYETRSEVLAGAFGERMEETPDMLISLKEGYMAEELLPVPGAVIARMENTSSRNGAIQALVP